jgi:hypothetical protein
VGRIVDRIGVDPRPGGGLGGQDLVDGGPSHPAKSISLIIDRMKLTSSEDMP